LSADLFKLHLNEREHYC